MGRWSWSTRRCEARPTLTRIHNLMEYRGCRSLFDEMTVEIAR